APVHVMSRDPDMALKEELGLLRRHPAGGDVPPYRSQFSSGTLPAALCDYIETRHGPVRAWGKGLDQPGTPLIYLHDLPGSYDLHAAEIEILAQSRPVLAFDLAGNAESPADGTPGQDIWLAQIQDVVDILGWPVIEIHAQGTSAALALGFAQRHPGRVPRLALRSPPLLTAEERMLFGKRYAPDIEPGDDGGYLLRLWHHLRDQELWYPWFDRGHAARRTNEPRIDPAWLTRRAIALLKQPGHYAGIWRDVLRHDVMAMLAASPVPVAVSFEPEDLFAPIAGRMEQR
ncbi:alpha/beta hydrolase, partial [Devosia sp.]|uniref:alpha/beta fold hydrolase n=1 Tax=Devosia sp. TaxID=1871048 RepID=UPI002AFE52DC